LTTAIHPPPEVKPASGSAQKETEKARQAGASPVGRTSTAEHGHYKESAPALVPEGREKRAEPAHEHAKHHQHGHHHHKKGDHNESSRMEGGSQPDGEEYARDPRNYK
jgi:hypothetical protein